MRKPAPIPTTEPTALWAIDPFQTEARPSPASAVSLMIWAAASHVRVQPVYLVPPIERWTPTRLSSAARMVDGYIQSLGITETLPAEVFSAEPKLLVRMAEQLASPFIIVSSHGRSGVERYVLGSFAEALLTQANRPVLFLPKSESQTAHRFERTLFATDLSKTSLLAFENLIRFSHGPNFEIVLYHSVNLPPMAMASNYGISVLIPDNYFSDQTKWAQSEGARWVDLAHAKGVKVRLIVENKGILANVGHSILAAADENRCGMIAISSNSPSVGALLFGKIAKLVFRNPEIPVLVHGPRFRSHNP